MKCKVVSLILFFLLLISCGFQISGAAEKPVVLDPVLSARFENMLNHNRLYGADFFDTNKVVDQAVLALLDRAENGFIKADIVDNFVYHMYGLTTDGYTADPNLTEKPGYYAIIPRGYSELQHTLTAIEEQDGLIVVRSLITVTPHDGDSYTADCETLFKADPASAFGYNILSSVIE